MNKLYIIDRNFKNENLKILVLYIISNIYNTLKKYIFIKFEIIMIYL